MSFLLEWTSTRETQERSVDLRPHRCKAQSGKRFDPDAVQACAAIVATFESVETGLWVSLDQRTSEDSTITQPIVKRPLLMTSD